MWGYDPRVSLLIDTSFAESDRPPGPALRQPVPNQYGNAPDCAQGLCQGGEGCYSNPLHRKEFASMDAPQDISMKTEDVLRVELEVFKREHRDLDEAIRALHERGVADQLTLQRLKKKKLFLKDKIALIEDRLTPDIIA
jgi:hypothetical protein